jgi:hypothetical protein
MAHAVSYFSGIQALIKGLRLVQARSGASASSVRGDGHQRTWQGLARQTLVERRHLINEVGLMMDRWPDDFLSMAKRKHLTYTDLMPSRGVLPMWIDRIGKTYLFRAQSKVTPEQQESVAHATSNATGFFGLSAARRLSGLSIAGAGLSAQWTPCASQEDCESLMASLDHKIAREPDIQAKLELTRDKVMFALAWFGGLSQVELSRFTLATIDENTTAQEVGTHPDFWSFPTSKSEMNAWLGWYLRTVRPKLDPGSKVQSVFVSGTTKRGLGPSSIGMKLRQHCLDSELHRKIPSYRAFSRRGAIKDAYMR